MSDKPLTATEIIKRNTEMIQRAQIKRHLIQAIGLLYPIPSGKYLDVGDVMIDTDAGKLEVSFSYPDSPDIWPDEWADFNPKED